MACTQVGLPFKPESSLDHLVPGGVPNSRFFGT